MSDEPEDRTAAPPQRPRRGDGPRARSRRRGAAAREGRDDGPPVEVAAGVDADHEKVARSVALRLLTSAPRSRAQLAQAMAKD